MPAGPNTPNGESATSLAKLKWTVNAYGSADTTSNSNTLAWLMNNNAPNRVYIDGHTVYCFTTNTNPITTNLQFCTSPSGASTNSFATITCTGWNTTPASNAPPNSVNVTGCTSSGTGKLIGTESTNSAIGGGQGDWIAGPNAATVPFSVLNQIGEGKNSSKSAFRLQGNNEDYTALRAAYTENGVNFTDLGPVSGTSSGTGSTNGSFTDLADSLQQDSPEDSANPTVGTTSPTAPTNLSPASPDAIELRYIGSRGTIITNPDGSLGMFLSGSWPSDGDSDAFNQIFYTSSSDGGQTWSVPKVVLSAEYEFNASREQDEALANGKDEPLGISAYYSGRAYGPAVVHDAARIGRLSRGFHEHYGQLIRRRDGQRELAGHLHGDRGSEIPLSGAGADTATCTTTHAATGGTEQITASYSGDANYAKSSGSISETVAEAPQITSPNAATFTENTEGEFMVIATGTPQPTISESGALPHGVTFSGGVLSGTPTQRGSFPITFTARNGVGEDSVQHFTLTVLGLHVTTTSLPEATPGTRYSVQLHAVGGVAPYRWSETGALPGKLKLRRSGVLTGKVQAQGSGSFPITVTVSSGHGRTRQSATATLTLTVS